MTKPFRISFLVFILLSAPALARADALDDAFKLLRLTNIDKQFNAASAEQTRDIIRTYSLIVSDAAEVQLPQAIKTAISKCYEESYDFTKFRRGIAEILVDTFSAKELELLVDFHSDLALPPSEISAFREIVAKAELVQRIGAEFILDNSEGCLQQGTNLVLDFLDTQQLKPN
ncbi:MAG: hypothetical protein ACI95C_002018 [Pseudohongiellaceae bacterium]